MYSVVCAYTTLRILHTVVCKYLNELKQFRFGFARNERLKGNLSNVFLLCDHVYELIGNS